MSMKTRAEEASTAGASGEFDIAVVGMAGRFPKAGDVDEFWSNILAGKACISYFSETGEEQDELTPEAPLSDGGHRVRARGTLWNADRFDAFFFGVNPREAALMDPQHRLFLEVAWHALEDANYEFDKAGQRVGVFAGSSLSTYLLNALMPAGEAGNYLAYLGNQADQLATRTAHKLDLRGPALSVQTACSSALTAVHLACRSLLAGECDAALAGGASVMFPQRTGYPYQPGGVFSPDGACRPFDVRAQGTVFSDGVGAVALKRLDDALRDGDPIHAVIKASAVNNDGADKIGFTAPSINGQQDVIRAAFSMAGLHVDSIDYVEAHGTGTELGDPIEFAALQGVFGGGADRRQRCALGSVKANIGHLDAAAGIAGLIKTILMLKHRAIPPQIRFENANPRIDLDASPFFIPREAAHWPEQAGHPRRACVSAFGVGGTNAHVIVEEAPVRAPSAVGKRDVALLPLSARSPAALAEMENRLRLGLADLAPGHLQDLANALQLGRKAQNWRSVLLAEEGEHGARALGRRAFDAAIPAQPQPVYFLFEGQIAARLPEAIRWSRARLPAFAEHFAHCRRILSGWLSPEEAAAVDAAMAEGGEIPPELVQPLLFAFEYATARQLMAAGVAPAGFCGHSLGEYVAACLAGVFDLETALLLVRERGLLMSATPAGAMLAVFASPEALSRDLPAAVEIAAVNAPDVTVVAGEPEAVHAYCRWLDERGVGYKLLPVGHAFHTRLMDAACEPFAALLRSIELRPPRMPFVSTVTGDWITEREATDPMHWVRQIRVPVCFAAAMQTLARQAGACLVDIGPSQILCRLAGLSGHADERLAGAGSESPDSYERGFMLQMGALWTWGWRIDWRACASGEFPRRTRAPMTVFEGARHWINPPAVGKGWSTHSRPAAGASLYRPAWRRFGAVEKLPEAGQGGRESWLIFGDGELSAQLRSALAERGHLVTLASPADVFGKIAKGHYGINPSRPGDYDALLRELRAFHRLPDHIVHMWLAGRAGEASPVLRTMGYASLANLARAFIASELKHKVRLAVVTKRAWDVIGDEAVLPEAAMVLGPAMTIPRECPSFSTLHVDLDGPVDAASLLRTIACAGQFQRSGPAAWAIRGRHAWERTIEPLPVRQGGQAYIRDSGFYLITGGLGGIGHALAAHLLEARARVLLLARDAAGRPPEKNALAQGRLRDLERFGANVRLETGDVAAPADVLRALEAGKRAFGQLNGVIHAAGSAHGRLLSLWSEDDAADMLRAKVEGMRVLGQALRDAPLDFFVACSSIASLAGGVGQTDYCAANAFLDATAHAGWLPNCGRMIALNWFTWKETGMAVDGAASGLPGHRESLEAGLATREALQAFDCVMSGSMSGQLAVSPLDPEVLARAIPNLDDLQAVQADESREPLSQRPSLSSSYRAPENPLQERIVLIAEEVFGIRSLGVEDDFLELGAHSLLFAQFASAIRGAFGVRIRLHSLFEERTVARLSLLVEELLIESVKSGEVS
ncbi:type I polyketide synthase [Chromobacterium vaccinii]|uniref:type I polyketide synthase n=1 Tax=Chromobacterium vaccinii TaxID=1108595 RepID=UPI0009E54431|nr:type I polyketide synthase [Chromobacterium vaccinii]